MQLCSFLASGITSCFLWHLHYSTSRAVLCCTVVQCKTSFDLLDVGSYRLTRCKTIFWRRFLSHDLFLVAKAAVFVHSLEITWVVFSQFSFSAQVVFDLADAMPCHLSRARCKFSPDVRGRSGLYLWSARPCWCQAARVNCFGELCFAERSSLNHLVFTWMS